MRFRLVFAICWLLWSLLHAFVLNWFGFSWPMAALDSFVSNLLLVGVSILVTVILQFYIPQKKQVRVYFRAVPGAGGHVVIHQSRHFKLFDI